MSGAAPLPVCVWPQSGWREVTLAAGGSAWPLAPCLVPGLPLLPGAGCPPLAPQAVATALQNLSPDSVSCRRVPVSPPPCPAFLSQPRRVFGTGGSRGRGRAVAGGLCALPGLLFPPCPCSVLCSRAGECLRAVGPLVMEGMPLVPWQLCSLYHECWAGLCLLQACAGPLGCSCLAA